MARISPTRLPHASLDVELEQQHVAVLDDVFLAFHPVEALLARGGHRAAFHEVVVGHGLGLDEPALEVGVDDAGRLRRGVAGVNRPRAHFLLAGGEVRPQAEQVVGGADQRADAALLHAQLLRGTPRLPPAQIHRSLSICALMTTASHARCVFTYSRTFST
jgi:hypothetical protein